MAIRSFLYWNVISIVKNTKQRLNGNCSTKITGARQEKNKKDFAVHQNINVRFTSYCFFAWDSSLISPPQNEKKKIRNANFRFYVRHSYDWRRHAWWKKWHCEIRPAYVALCHSEVDANFREIMCENRKVLLPEWTKCRSNIECLPQNPWIAPRAVHCQSSTRLDS